MATVNANNWMSAVDNATSIHTMSIPGTHESCARHGVFSKCQNLSITDQLNRGIRFLDIRCKYRSSERTVYFPIHHGPDYQEINFVDVQRECIDFLNLHESEAILMNVQQEVSDDGPPFGSKFMELINAEYWHLGTTIPTLGAIRKKIVLIRANDPVDNGGGWSVPDGPQPGLQWTGFKHSGRTNTAPFETQNKWSGVNGTDKGAMVENHLDWAAGGTQYPDWIYLNFLSYAQANIGDAASDMNNRILNYIKTGPQFVDKSKRLGVLPMDFCGNTGPTGGGCLEDEIIRHNRFIDSYRYDP